MLSVMNGVQILPVTSMAEMKAWQELIGMNGGPVRPPVLPISDAARNELAADLAATGLIDRAHGGRMAAE